MKTGKWFRIALMWLGTAVFLAGQTTVRAQDTKRTWRVPVLMEEATVRGKVVVLETRREDRRAVENLLIQVWTAPDEAEELENAAEEQADETVEAEAETEAEKEEPKLVHETRTDENGLFSLPVLSVGVYRLVIGELSVQLRVMPKHEERKDQEEPKILLILLPKEVIT